MVLMKTTGRLDFGTYICFARKHIYVPGNRHRRNPMMGKTKKGANTPKNVCPLG